MEQNENIENQNAAINDNDTTASAAQQSQANENSGSANEENLSSRRARKKRSERHMEEMNQKVEQMGMKLAEMNDKYMRLYSEYENYRKRTSAEKAGLIINGGKDVIKLMLPILDDMERAISNMADDDAAKEGMQLILKNMLNALQQKGLKPMEAMGVKFDENYHEAITQIPATDPQAKGTVIDVVKKGYFLNDEVIRFAQVVVAN
ncbi:MAG: nucleotide exchange factor GrpE [Bacteroidales bacterium]|nr:nucleotide exchange factor GrpE [Bacteroidales bacterium]